VLSPETTGDAPWEPPARSDVRALALLACCWAAYVVLFGLAHAIWEIALFPFGLFITGFAGWMFGMRAGLLSGLATLPIHLTLVYLTITAGPEQQEWMESAMLVTPVFMVSGGMTGYWRRTRDQLQREIYERRQAESALARRAVHETALLGALPDLFFVLDRHGTFVDSHAPTNDQYLMSPESFIGLRVEEVLPEHLSRQFYEHLRVAETTHQPQTFMYQLSRPQQSARDFEARLVLVPDQDEVLLIVRDITERRQAEAERQRLAEVVESSAQLVAISNAEGQLEFLNDAGQRMTGLTGAAIEGMNLNDLLDPADVPTFQAAVAAAPGGAVLDLELMLVSHSGGAPRRGRGSLHQLSRKREGGRIRLALLLEDMTERLQAEAGMARADRMASLGLLAAGVAHEINNPLTYVLYNLVEIAEALDGGALEPGTAEELAVLAADAVTGTRRVRDIVKNLKTFSRHDDPTPRLIEVNSGVELALTLSWNELKYQANVEQELGRGLTVMGTEPRLAQIFLNLLINAAQSIEARGPERAGPGKITIRAQAEGESVRVGITDTGVGIAPQDMARIFDPFFTTRPVGSGSGLGLSICHNLVSGLGGRIEVDSELGVGSTFTVVLPLVTSVPKDPQPTDVTPLGVPRRARVLIVDDEPLLGAAVARRLPEHETEVATSGREAIEILGREDFDVVLCDLMMEDVTGMGLHAWLTEHEPAVTEQLIFMTGGVYTPESRAFVKRVSNTVLEKPVDIEALKRLIQQLHGED